MEVENNKDVKFIRLNSIEDCEPFDYLRSIYNLQVDYQILEQMVDDEGLPDVTIVKISEPSTPIYLNNWMMTISRWADACHGSGSNHSIGMILPADMALKLELPPKDIRLTYKIWAGIPSFLETRLLCRWMIIDWMRNPSGESI